MRYFKCAAWFFIFLILTDFGYSQTILKRSKKYVIVDIDETFGLNPNDRVNVYKKLITDDIQNVGTLKIVVFKKGKCIGQILSESPQFPIEAGDFISMENNFSKKKNKHSSAALSSSSKSNFLTYLSFGTGIIASGLGYYFYDQANQTYQNYEAATNSQDAVKLYDDTISHDKKSKIGFGVGGGLIAVGIISYLVNRSNPQPQSNTFSLQPVQKNNFVGFKMNWCFNHPSKKYTN